MFVLFNPVSKCCLSAHCIPTADATLVQLFRCWPDAATALRQLPYADRFSYVIRGV